MSQRRFLPSTLLVSVAGIWGIAFVSMKTTLLRLDVYSFLAWRFFLATSVLILIRPKVLKLFNFQFLKKGSLVGVFLGCGYIFQSIGLTKTTVGKTGFITGLYVVFTPLVAAIFLKKRISRWDWFSTALATFGLGLLSLKGFGMGLGEFLVLVSAMLFALHILALSQWASDMDVYALTTVQLGTCALLTFIATIPNGFKAPPDTGVWGAIIFTAIFATALAFIIQTWTQSFMPATTVAVILTLESVFAAGFGLAFLEERATFRIITGGILVILAMYIIIFADGQKGQLEVNYHD